MSDRPSDRAQEVAAVPASIPNAESPNPRWDAMCDQLARVLGKHERKGFPDTALLLRDLTDAAILQVEWPVPSIKAMRRITQLDEELDALAAQGTEARRAETENTGSVHDGPVGEADAPKDNQP